MPPPLLAPTVEISGELASPSICRLSPGQTLLAFWVSEASPRTLFVAPIDQPTRVGDLAQPVLTTTEDHLSDLAWSPDGQYLAFTLTSGPPPGDVRIGVLRLSDRKLVHFPGITFAWAGAPSQILIADSANKRLYLRDLETKVEHTLTDLADDGDPHFPPVICVAHDFARFAIVTRSVLEGWTRVHLARRDGDNWTIDHLTDLPGVSIRVVPFWSFNSTACALYIIDMERNQTAMIGVPAGEGPGEVIYSSNAIDAAIRPAAHPGGRLIVFIRAHPREGSQTLFENRLVFLDPVEKAVAPLTANPELLGQPRFLDEKTLVIEGRAVWTVKLTADLIPAEPDPAAAQQQVGHAPPIAPSAVVAQTNLVRTTVPAPNPAWSFACDIPEDWKRVPLPPDEPDFEDPRVMRPLCVFTAPYAPILFTVAVRPCPPGAVMPGAAPQGMLNFLASVQELPLEDPQSIQFPAGLAAVAMSHQESEAGRMTFRLALLEHGGYLFSLTTMAPDPLWEALRPTLEQVMYSFRPRAGATPFA